MKNMSERQKKRLAQREAIKLKRRMIDKVRKGNVAFNLNLLVDGWLELESDPGTFSLLIEDFGCYGAQVDEIYDLDQKFDGPVLGFIFLFKWINNQQNDRSRNYQKFNNNSIVASNNNNNSIDNNTTKDKGGEEGGGGVAGDTSSNQQNHWTYVEDETIISEIFFAKQMISNSCATHALISILLNCDYHELNLGPSLTRLKEHTKIMDPENKGYAIGNLPELAKAHNSHASYSSLYNRNKLGSHSSTGMSYMISGNQRTNLQQQKKHEAYHFVSYVPINNRLYELDGLKNYPIDHGPIDPKIDWTEKFRSVIKQRLLANKTSDDSTVSNEIRYNLMAVVPDRRVHLRAELKKLKTNQTLVQDSIQRLTKRVFSPMTVDVDIPNPPYSPLSNGTLTASEIGSVFNSPTHLEDTFFSEDYDKIDKFFVIKFNQKIVNKESKEDNSEPAHKNCIIDIETTNLLPINLRADLETMKNRDCDTDMPEEDVDSKRQTATITNNIKDSVNNKQSDTSGSSSNINNNISNNCESNQSTNIKLANQVMNKLETNIEQVNQDIKTEKSDSHMNTKQEIPKTNGVVGEDDDATLKTKINEVTAHNNEKYNLSSQPPFDFNILDDLQHVHFGKSTLRDMKSLSGLLLSEINKLEAILKEENDKRRKYKIDNSRRTHNYEPFIRGFLSLLAKQGNLADLIEKDLGIVPEEIPIAAQVTETTNCKTNNKPSNNNNTIATSKLSASTSNGSGGATNNSNTTRIPRHLCKPPSRSRYVKTGRPVGRPRKNPLAEQPLAIDQK